QAGTQRNNGPVFYANWARLAFFSSALATDVTTDRRTVYDIGAQVDLSLVLFASLDSTLSVGYASAFGEGSRSDEVMISLKLLR
ncbi:MAG: hypothetical protein ABIO78_03245, partial [Thermoanaerobaculia bacterium]